VPAKKAQVTETVKQGSQAFLVAVRAGRKTSSKQVLTHKLGGTLPKLYVAGGARCVSKR